jgi:hypothetical protein
LNKKQQAKQIITFKPSDEKGRTMMMFSFCKRNTDFCIDSRLASKIILVGR